MKLKSISYERTANLGNFESSRVGVTIELDEGEKSQGVLEKARLFCEKALSAEVEANQKIKRNEKGARV